ncbi:MAG: hypothetical protein M0P69_21985 [Bacteroidales bacterium]|nr:hypothetical protein [Bacteroidales bacterium]
MRFAQPFYVSPHAVQRFRERVADLPTRTIRVIIQAALQGCRQLVGYQIYDRKKCPVYKARYQGSEYMIPVRIEKRKVNAWEVVPTILSPGMRIYTERMAKHANTHTDTANPGGCAENRNGSHTYPVEGETAGQEGTQV